jgi:hypothetical protein
VVRGLNIASMSGLAFPAGGTKHQAREHGLKL